LARPGIASTDPDSELELVIKPLTRAKDRLLGACGHRLPARAMKALLTNPDRRGTPVVTHRQPLEVGHQRIVGPEQAPDVGRMMHRGVHVGVVADPRRHCVFDLGQWHEAVGQAFVLRKLLAKQA